MPILPQPNKDEFIPLPPRRARLAADTDVLVVGGGPAGIGAALGAAKAGARVVLVERYGFLGGNATVALVMPLMSFHTQFLRKKERIQDSYKLWPLDHGPGEPVIAGVLKEFLHELEAEGGAIFPSLRTGYVVPFDPEVFKWTALKMLTKEGVQMLFHAFASSTLTDDKAVNGAVFETKSGPIVVKARIIVDATGDADIAHHAGCPYTVGRTEDGLTQPMTLMFRVGNFERTLFADYIREHPNQWRGVYGLWDLIKKASREGALKLPREDILLFDTVHERELSVNSTRITNMSGVNVWELSLAEYIGRHQMRQIVEFLRKYVPGFEEAYLLQSGVQVGIRETRRIEGLYSLSEDDILSARKFGDCIARSSYPIDIHNPAGKGTVLKHLPMGESYDIPLRCLIPKNVDRLFVAGRCISGTHEASSSYRVMPVCMATGQAAGVAAALCAKHHVSVKQISPEDVQEELLSQGANLGEGKEGSMYAKI